MQGGAGVSIEALFRAAVQELRKRNIDFAVAGGLAADLYRSQPRLTMDVDFVVVTEPPGLKMATAVIESLGLRAGIAREADLAGGPLFAIRRRNTKACMVVGRREQDSGGEGVDLLLPAILWAKDAVRRAQANQVDFGFGPVPALTLEDVIVSKLSALNSARLRAKDLDDLQSIFAAGHDMDTPYLAGQMQRFKITIPRKAQAFLPDSVLQISHDVARALKKGRKQ
jgi:hypothetical protein